MANLTFVKLQVVTLKLQNVGMIVVEVIKTLRLSNDTTNIGSYYKQFTSQWCSYDCWAITSGEADKELLKQRKEMS